jgi:intein/homing endonuclease
MTVTAGTKNLSELKVGDIVVVKRNLDNPMWARYKKDEIDEKVCICNVTDLREIPAVAGFGGREAKTLARVATERWYDIATGLQEYTGATYIEPHHN